MSNKLTIKQREFIKEYIKNKGNGSKAIRKAYPNIKTDNARMVMSSRLLRNDKVVSAVDKELEKAGLSKDWIVSETKKVLKEAEYTRDKLTGLRLLADIGGYTKPNTIMQQAVPVFNLSQEDIRDARDLLDRSESQAVEESK
jgi:phage terminase small subunit